jgi:lipopolysaccharide export system permease protein
MLKYKYYIIKSIIPAFLVIVLSITTLVWITQILKLLYLIDKGVKIGHFFNLIILVVPYLLFTLLPFATIISIIYVYSYLSEGRQLIILQNLGLRNIQLANPALLFAFFITLFSYYISSILLPESYKKLKEDLYFMRNNYATNIVSEKTFTQVSKGITLYFDEKMQDGRLKGLVLFDNRRTSAPKILFADTGVFTINESHPILRLLHGLRQEYDANNNIIFMSY